MAELLASYSKIPTLKKGDVVEGRVKTMTAHEITLDIGAKSDALVLEYDKQNFDNLTALLNVGDLVKATVLSPEAEEGFPVVSLRRTLDDLIFAKLEDAYKKDQPIDVLVIEQTRGGLFVSTEAGVRAFLPSSQLLSDANAILNTLISVKIVEYDRPRKRVIVSEKALEYITDPAEIEKVVKKEQTIEAVVSAATPHGIYVVLTTPEGKPIEGFIHISEVSYQRVENLQDMYTKGDTLKAQVIEVDRENRRVTLSLKRLEQDTFIQVKEQLPKEKKLKATVKDVKSRGVTVELGEGILGFIPASKVPSEKEFKAGDQLDVEVEDYDDKHRLVLVTPVLTVVPIGYR